MSVITNTINAARDQIEEAVRVGRYPSGIKKVFTFDVPFAQFGDNSQFPILCLYDTGEERVVVPEDADGNIMFEAILYCKVISRSHTGERASIEVGEIDQTVKRFFLSKPTLSDNQRDVQYLETQDRGVVVMANAHFGMAIHRIRFLYVTTPETA